MSITNPQPICREILKAVWMSLNITDNIEDADHLELKKIADEATTEFDKFSKIRKKKASGGLAHLLGE
jgi:hypothetical protein